MNDNPKFQTSYQVSGGIPDSICPELSSHSHPHLQGTKPPSLSPSIWILSQEILWVHCQSISRNWLSTISLTKSLVRPLCSTFTQEKTIFLHFKEDSQKAVYHEAGSSRRLRVGGEWKLDCNQEAASCELPANYLEILEEWDQVGTPFFI